MKKSLLVTLSSAVVISGVMFFNNNTEDATTNQSKIKKTETAKVFSERKKKMKGLMPFDKPDMFEKFHAQIRTKKGQSESDYELNYTFNEYEKAVRAVGLSKRNDNIVWKERGPGNVSGRTRGIIVDVSDKTNNTWYAGSAGGGIWKTVNAGVSWTEKTFKNLNLATTSLVQAKSNPYIMYAGTGEGFGGGGAIKGNGIFKSVDRGETWFQLESTAGNIDFGYVNRLIVDPSNDKIIIASTNTAIMKSYDGGNSWKKVYDAGDKVQQIITDPTSFSIQYATEKSAGVLKSVDAGETWTLSTSGIETKKRIEIGISPSNPKILYASVEAGSESHLYRTSDAAASWTRINYTNTTDPKWLKSQGWYDNTVAVNPFDENIVYLGGVDTWRADVSSDITSENRIKDVLKENTDAIFKFVNWGGPAAGGGLGKGSDFYDASWYKDVVDVQPEDFVSVELRFGNGLTQKAYRFERNSTSGQYEYKDYIEVPFQVWDIVNNKQLSLSFRDWAKNGEFDLIPYDKNNLTREYLSVNAVEYSESADANLAKDDGFLYKNIYSMWLYAATESSWNPSALPSAKLTVDYGKVESGKAFFTRLTDWWRDVKHPQYTHADHHNFTIVVTGDTTFRFIDGNDGGVAYSDDKGANWIQPTNGFNSTQFYGADKHPTKDEYVGGTQDNGSFKSTIGEDA
ncbi:MAG: WD40/YVTN/BNR-like repeat-containing protein, partial [Rhodothermaceae bacterium]